MTRVDFYILKTAAAPDARLRLACRVAAKAYRMGRRVYLHTRSAVEASRLDEVLWTFDPGSFVPHSVYNGGDCGEFRDPVVIGHEEPVQAFDDVLISLADEVTSFFSRFERLAEVVGGSGRERAAARERFRFYRERGYPLATHEVDI